MKGLYLSDSAKDDLFISDHPSPLQPPTPPTPTRSHIGISRHYNKSTDPVVSSCFVAMESPTTDRSSHTDLVLHLLQI